MKRFGFGLLFCLLWSCAPVARTIPPTARATIDPAEIGALRADVTFLASDVLEGRGVGLAGLDRAADFIADRYTQLGVRPLPGDERFFQPFAYTLDTSVGPKTALKFNSVQLNAGTEFTPLPLSLSGNFSGPLVFVGYGISDADRHYDDYASVDVHGKIAVAFRYEPHTATGGSNFTKTADWSDDAGLVAKANVAANHGAIALVLVNPPTYHGIDLLLAPTMLHSPHAAIPVLQVKQSTLARFMDLKAKQSVLDRTMTPASEVIEAAVASGTIDIRSKLTTVKNVVAMLPGYGPHADEYVVVGAHYDHLGRGGPGSLMFGSHEIHHGADDNASGTAAVLATARRLAAAGRLPRSVLFVNFTAEEEGLIGSGFFMTHPPVPISKMVAMVNLDMVGRVRDKQLFVGGSGTDPDFDSLLASADKNLPLQLKDSGPYIGRGGFGPSDHMSFAMHKVPVLFLFSGMHGDYHRPTDTADKLNYTDLENVVTLTHRLVDEFAIAPREPYDSRFDSQSALAELIGTGGGNDRHASLGVVPDYASDSTVGVRITGTVDGSPADKAGLREGDLLTRIGSMKLNSLYDLQDFLTAAKPGDQVPLEYVRAKQIFKTDIILGERRG